MSDPMPDPQDPLPEPGFSWRRWLTFGVTMAIIALFWFLTWKLPASDLLAFSQGLMLLLALIWLLYMGGASATDVSRIIASASLFKQIGFGSARPAPPADTGELSPEERIQK